MRWFGGRRRAVVVTAAGVIVLVLAGLAVSAFSGSGSPPAASPMRPAPPFRLKALGHPGTISLAALRGKPVIINFFASWCSPCRRETPVIARFYDTDHGQVAVIGVDANDKTASALSFLRSAGVRYPVGADPYPAPTALAYDVQALPQTFFLNSAHRIARHLIGPMTMRQLEAAAAAISPGHR